MAEDKKLLYVTDRREWRRWLLENFEKERAIWLVIPNKASGQPRLAYNDAVEEALCFGWIDSKIVSLDARRSAQKFSRRSPKSGYSQPNVERLRWLAGKGLLHPSVEAAVAGVIAAEYAFPPDILAEIRKDGLAWKNFCAFSEAYRRIRIAYVDSARKRPEEYRKRLDNLIRKARENKMIGYGGIEKYY